MTKIVDGREIIEDGERLTVGVMLMDGMQRAVADQTVVTDTAGHRPGGLVMTDADRERRTAVYRDYNEKISARWQGLPQPVITTDAKRPTGDARLDAYARYQERVSNAWRHQ